MIQTVKTWEKYYGLLNTNEHMEFVCDIVCINVT